MQLNLSSYLSGRQPCSSFHFDGSSLQRWWSVRVVQILEPRKRQTFDNSFWILIPMIRQIEKDTIRKKINQEKHMEMLTDSGFEVAHNWTLEQTLFLSQPKKTEIGVGVQTRSIDKIVFMNQMLDCFFVWTGFEQLWSCITLWSTRENFSAKCHVRRVILSNETLDSYFVSFQQKSCSSFFAILLFRQSWWFGVWVTHILS